MSSVDYQRRELTHACSRSDTEACDMCYVFNVNLTDSFDAVWSNDRAAPTNTNPKNLELAPPQSVTATRLDQLVYSPNYYIQIFQTQPFARSEDWTLNLHARSYQVQRAYQLRYGRRWHRNFNNDITKQRHTSMWHHVIDLLEFKIIKLQ